MRYRQEQILKCTFTAENFIELLCHQNEEHSGEFIIEASSDAKNPNQEEELQVRLDQSWHLKK